MADEQSTALVPAQPRAVSQSYDQVDNVYKEDEGAKAVAIREQEQQAVVVAEEREQEESRIEKVRRHMKERRNRIAREHPEESGEIEDDGEDLKRQLEESRAEAEREREQEILRRHQTERTKRHAARERAEAQAIENKAWEDMIGGGAQVRHQRERQARSDRRDRQRIDTKAEEDMLRGARDRNAWFSQKYGRATENVNDALGNMFGGQQDRRYKTTADQYQRKRAHETFFGGMADDIKRATGEKTERVRAKARQTSEYFTAPGLGGRLAKSMDRAAGAAYNRTKFHMQRSWNDSFLVPIGYERTDPRTGRPVRATRRAQLPSIVNYGGNLLYGIPGDREHRGLVPRGRAPTGILFSTGSLLAVPAHRMLLFQRAPRTRLKKSKRAPVRRQSSGRFLDRLLYF